MIAGFLGADMKEARCFTISKCIEDTVTPLCSLFKNMGGKEAYVSSNDITYLNLV